MLAAATAAIKPRLNILASLNGTKRDHMSDNLAHQERL
jgi:hypothetical protein